MSKSNAFENDLLKLIFQAIPIANICDDAATSPLTSLYVALHTGDPGEAGVQTTSECAYTSYARVAVARSAAGFTVTDNSVSPAANIDFPSCSAGTETATHFSIGVASSGANKVLYKGAIAPTIAISSGVIARLSTASTVTED